MSIGSLKEQIIYPDTLEDMADKKITDEKIREILKMVSLEQIAVRDSFDEVRDWKDTLSGGVRIKIYNYNFNLQTLFIYQTLLRKIGKAKNGNCKTFLSQVRLHNCT